MAGKRAISLVLATVLIAGSVFKPVHAESIHSAEQKGQQLEEQKKQAEKEQESLSERLNSIITEMQTAQANVEKKEDEIAVAEDELVEAEIKENKQYESMLIRIKYVYENGNSEMMQILLEAEDMGDFLNKTEYVEQVSQYDRKMLDQFAKLVKEVEKKEKSLKKEKESLVVLQKDLETKQKEVQTLLDSKKEEIAKLNAQIGENTKTLNALIEKAKEAERRKQEAENANKKPSGGSGNKPGAPVISGGNGYLSNPCPAGRITSEFGPREAPVPGASTFHEGRDYGAPIGTPIYAAAEGTVIRTGNQAVRGNYVVIRHPNGLTTWYQHCTDIFVSKGQKVSRGQNIATVGKTGRVSGPHLHFIVEEASGELVDPRKYL